MLRFIPFCTSTPYEYVGGLVCKRRADGAQDGSRLPLTPPPITPEQCAIFVSVAQILLGSCSSSSSCSGAGAAGARAAGGRGGGAAVVAAGDCSVPCLAS